MTGLRIRPRAAALAGIFAVFVLLMAWPLGVVVISIAQLIRIAATGDYIVKEKSHG